MKSVIPGELQSRFFGEMNRGFPRLTSLSKFHEMAGKNQVKLIGKSPEISVQNDSILLIDMASIKKFISKIREFV